MKRTWLAVALAVGLVTATAVSGAVALGAVNQGSIPAVVAAKKTPTVVLPPTTGYVDYQLGGAYAVPKGVTIVARDSTDSPAAGVYSICYINGFQTQPADRKTWLKSRKSLVLHYKGKPVVDKNWPDELILDTSTKKKRTAIAKIMAKTIASCGKKGFDAIEIDNLDSFTRSKKQLSYGNNREQAKLYASAAHKAGLAIAQKNSAEYAAKLKKSVKFDFAVAEECYRWNECSTYTSVYGARVIDIEYADDLRGTFADACKKVGKSLRLVLRDRDLVTPKSSDYIYKHC